MTRINTLKNVIAWNKEQGANCRRIVDKGLVKSEAIRAAVLRSISRYDSNIAICEAQIASINIGAGKVI